ncbi:MULTISPECIES: hypothetical protein [Myxococcus]|uniref:hypothetical protein n=1 Tax=Myxococcus TaxID=32 RepID=UPI0002DCCC6E|nr:MULTISPECIES: hypothetical protein [Myxococcus]QZZ52566.1 hypothetical protein MyxoNM_25480 [Myxococcus xanthus]UYI12277.1 hypothetical protein N3T43_24795 [Myxococcus xanthus]UYI19645.1 hypothetical protein N1129_25245 [Myxococcus xanthus]SDY19562.1 hypothetical protein SAMN05444383_12344 [Myxococcus xanthus]
MKHTAPFHCPRLMLLMVAILAAACRSTPFQVRGAVPESLGASAVVVQPFGFQWAEPDWRSVELSQRLVNVALAQTGDAALFFGPTELQVARPGEDGGNGLTRAVVATLASYGVRPDGLMVLRPSAEKRIQSGERELIDTEGYTVGQSATEVVMYVGRVEVLHPATHEVVLEVFGEATVNPYADILDEGADPAPELTSLMEALTREALRGLSSHLKPPRAPSPALATSLAWAPWDVLDMAAWMPKDMTDLEAPLRTEAGQDPRSLRMQRLRFANPHADAALLETLARRPGGLYVRAAPEGAKLSAGDLVLTLDGRPALPQTLARARLALVPVEARVQQPSGRIVPLVLP